jgi:hypothetical protein
MKRETKIPWLNPFWAKKAKKKRYALVVAKANRKTVVA